MGKREVSFLLDIYAFRGSGNMDVTVELSDDEINRLQQYMDEHEPGGYIEDFSAVAELRDIYEKVDTASFDALVESYDMDIDSFIGEFDEAGLDIYDYEDREEYVRDNYTYFVNWPHIISN